MAGPSSWSNRVRTSIWTPTTPSKGTAPATLPHPLENTWFARVVLRISERKANRKNGTNRANRERRGSLFLDRGHVSGSDGFRRFRRRPRLLGAIALQLVGGILLRVAWRCLGRNRMLLVVGLARVLLRGQGRRWASSLRTSMQNKRYARGPPRCSRNTVSPTNIDNAQRALKAASLRKTTPRNTFSRDMFPDKLLNQPGNGAAPRAPGVRILAGVFLRVLHRALGGRFLHRGPRGSCLGMLMWISAALSSRSRRLRTSMQKTTTTPNGTRPRNIINPRAPPTS